MSWFWGIATFVLLVITLYYAIVVFFESRVYYQNKAINIILITLIASMFTLYMLGLTYKVESMEKQILYVYENHCGGDNFVKERELTDEERYCPNCKTSDILLYKGSKNEILKQLKRKIAFAKNRLEKAKKNGTTDDIINKEIEVENAEMAYRTAVNDLRHY